MIQLRPLLFTLCCLGALACNNSATPGTAAANPDSVQHAAALSPFSTGNFAGYFADTIPCADCAGIVTHLDLKKDSSFIMEQEYLGAKDTAHRFIYQLGSWTVVDSTLRLSEVTEGPRQFTINHQGELGILDNEGAVITNTALKYTLRRQTGSFRAQKSILVHGLFTLAGEAASLHVCSMDKDFAAVLTPAAKNMEAAYKALKNGAPVFTEVEGNFEDQPDANGKAVFSVTRFIRFTPGEKCK